MCTSLTELQKLDKQRLSNPLSQVSLLFLRMYNSLQIIHECFMLQKTECQGTLLPYSLNTIIPKLDGPQMQP
jgi:hypothetical protein